MKSLKAEWKEKGYDYNQLVKESAGVCFANPDIFLVMEIEFGIEDSLVLARVDHNKPEDVHFHQVKVHYGDEDNYVRVAGRKIPMSEFTRFGNIPVKGGN